MKNTTVITLGIHKGGAGKSSICCNLAYALSTKGYKVLVIDTDDQMNLSHSLNFYESNEEVQTKNFYKVMVNYLASAGGSTDISDYIIHTEYENMDIVPGSKSISTLPILMNTFGNSSESMTEIMKRVVESGTYDFILIDTDKAQGTMSISILAASDYVIIPMMPTQFGMEGIGGFVRHLNSVKKLKSELGILGVVLNHVDIRESAAWDMEPVIKEAMGNEIPFDTWIIKDRNVDKAQAMRRPVAVAFPKTKAVEAYESFANEVIERVSKK